MKSSTVGRWVARIGAVVAAVVLVMVTVAGLAVWRLQTSIDRSIERFDLRAEPAAETAGEAVAEPPGEAVAETSGEAVTLLVLGSDSRISVGDPTRWAYGAQRTDAIMVVHIPADRSGVDVVSIPRDTWVDIPGHGRAKINASFSWGGPALTVQTVEQLTGLSVDHMVITDFTGFARLTDLLGGVDVTVAETTHGNTHGQGQNFTAGTHHLDGATALDYVRQRYVLPGGDFDRVKRQQNWIRAIGRTAAESGVRTDPRRLHALLEAMASSLATDEGFTIGEMRDLVLSLRHVEPGGVRFLTVPVEGTGTSADGQSIVVLDVAEARTLWRAMAADQTETWLAETGQEALGTTVR